MSHIFQNLHRNQAIPLSISSSDSSSTKGKTGQAIRRRLSSLSLSAAGRGDGGVGGANSWAFPRSKSVEYAGNTVRSWWNWGWALILSKKPTFAQDLEMNEEESAALGYHNKGSLRHVFYKFKKEIAKLIPSSSSSSHNLTLPQTFKYSKI